MEVPITKTQVFMIFINNMWQWKVLSKKAKLCMYANLGSAFIDPGCVHKKLAKNVKIYRLRKSAIQYSFKMEDIFKSLNQRTFFLPSCTPCSNLEIRVRESLEFEGGSGITVKEKGASRGGGHWHSYWMTSVFANFILRPQRYMN